MNKNLNTSARIGLKNEKIIVELLRKYGSMSYKRINEITGFSISTISDIHRRLKKKGLTIEIKGYSKSRGAKPIIIDLNPRGVYIAGTIINSSNIVIGLFGLNLEEIEIIEIRVKDTPSPQNIPHLLQKHLFNLMDKHHIPRSKLKAIGVTLPGLITSDGIVACSTPLYWNNIPLKKILSEHFNCLITLHRFIALRSLFSEYEAIYEIWGQCVILHLTLADGIGSHLILNQKIASGSTGFLGEIGHIVLDPSGSVCGCGNRGCVESLISGPAIAKKILNDIKAGKQTILKSLIKNEKDTLSVINKWGKALKNRDAYALELLDFVGENFGKIIAIAIICYDPNIIVLSGYVAKQCPEYLINIIKKKIATEICGSQYRNIRFIVESKEEEKAFVRSVATTALWELQQSQSL
ncbi:MAG: ROK family transcriptional regulator [Promethearchaeota archaeon]|jgi:predicted NBD/HSP70 family sugar kinase